jgi:CheY-like chemotaxis protein
MDCRDLQEDPPPGTPEAQPRRILAAVSDLLFTSKISAAAKQLGLPVEFFRDREKLCQAAASGAPGLVLVDLNNSTLDPIELIAVLKADPSTQPAQVIGYVSHVQHERRREAEKAGCDLVLPRSVFSQNLIELLRQRSCHI